jgi:2-O-methyltransferase
MILTVLRNHYPGRMMRKDLTNVSRGFTYYPQLYTHRPEYGDYLNPGFMNQVERETVRTIFEVGCADGEDTLRLAAAFPAQIHAFECNPEALVEARLRGAGVDAIRLVEKAAWDANCTIPFFPVTLTIEKETGKVIDNPGASSCFEARLDYLRQYVQSEIMVEAVRLDTYCAQHGITSIDLLCMDAQGAELRVLKGLGKVLQQVRYVITEIEIKPLYYDQSVYPEVHGYLKASGFRQAAEVYRDPWFSDYLYVRA